MAGLRSIWTTRFRLSRQTCLQLYANPLFMPSFVTPVTCQISSRLVSSKQLSITPFSKSFLRNVTSQRRITIEAADSQPQSQSLSDRIFQQISVENFAKLYATKDEKYNKETRSRIEEILYIYEREKYTETMEVPTTLTESNMIDLLRVFPEEKELLRSFRFYFKRECARANEQRRKEARKASLIEARRSKYNRDNVLDMNAWQVGIFDQNEQLVYGLWHNSLLSRITKQAVRDYRHRLATASSLFGQKLIIDLDYDQHMKLFEARLLAGQIGILFYENRANTQFPSALPFDVHFTNCSAACNTLPAIASHIKRMDRLEGHFHAKSYLDYPQLFARDRLVYLSPHADKPLRNYSHDDIYILGGYNDKSSHVRVSHIKAQNQSLRCYRLPLDEYVHWRQGDKNLCLNQVVAILHAVKANGDWKQAIERFAPYRKMKSSGEIELEDEIRKRAMAKRLNSIRKSIAIKKYK